MGCLEIAYRIGYRVSEKQGELTLEAVSLWNGSDKFPVLTISV
jgi:hypothetical protein